MKTKSQNKAPHLKLRQRGAALIILMLIIVLSLVTLVTFRSERKGPELEAQRKTALALAQAKEALLGRAASDDDPGTVSCPSNDLIGTAGGSGCPVAAAPSIIPKYAGRFPWRTLGVGNLYDGVGERLWYVMSQNFVDSGKSVPPSTSGTIRVNGGATNVVAVIVAPGASMGGQNRSAGNENILNNYLESYVDASNINTALGNDQIITITTSEVFNIVTQRMAREFALEISVEAEYPDTGWLPTSAIWTVGRFSNWRNVAITKFTKLSSTMGTLRFPPCVGEFTIQRTVGSDEVVTGKVSC